MLALQFVAMSMLLNAFVRGQDSKPTISVTGDSVRYRSSQEKAQLDKLRLQAVQVAKERAQAMANELGAELSAIKSIGNSRSISGGSDSGMGMGASRFGGRDDPFESSPSSTSDGQITLRNSVDVVFYLGNSEFKKQ